MTSIADMLAKISETKSFIILSIMFILSLSYIYICLIGTLYNKDHRKSILGSKYRLTAFSICIVLSIVCLIFRSFSILSAAVGSLLGICIVDIILVGLNLFTGDSQEEPYIYTEYWAKGCPFEKRKSDGKPVFKKKK